MTTTRHTIQTRPTLHRFLALAGLAAAVVMLTAQPAGAQRVATGVQEYFILGWEQHIWDMMDRVQNGQGGAQFDDGMNSVVTATASADNQLVFYDHWEDGLDPALALFPAVTLPLQASTLVIGDGDASNGEACDFNANISCGDANDVLQSGDYVNFNSDQGLVSNGDPDCAVPSADPAYTRLCNAVELNPRCATAGACTDEEFRFDGGDMIRTTGGPLSLIHSQYPLTNFIGGSTEILSRQAVEAARSYSVPIGEDLYVANTVTEPFHYVELELVAFEDTSITVDSPGAGTVSFTLARGEHWSSMGFIDDTAQPSLALTINSGTKVSTTSPIAGMIFTGGDGTWATRHYALLPDILHSTDYVTTAPGDDPGVGNPADRPANVYILNPDQISNIDVTITDSSGSYSVNIPPNQMRSMQDLAPGRDIAAGSTVRLTSDRNFWGVTAYDYDTNVSDWGHSWLAKKFLTRNYTVSFGPGNQDPTDPGPPPAGTLYANPVFIAATEDRTLIQFDLDNDDLYDQVDLDGDGAADVADDPVTNSYLLGTPDALRVWDPNDNDMTGTRIIANKPIAVSWGQETESTEYGDWALDTGFTIYPTNQLFLDPALTIEKTADKPAVPLSDPAAGRIVTYTLTIKSYDFGPLNDGKVFDLLPVGVTNTDYVPNSTLITYPNLTQDNPEPTATLQPSGRYLLEWPLTSDPPYGTPPDNPFSYGTNQTVTVQYQVQIPAQPGGPPRRLINEGRAEATLGGSVFSPTDIEAVVQTDADIVKEVDDTTPAPGDVLTYTLTVTNNGATNDETNVIVSDSIPNDTTYCDATIDPANCLDPTFTAPFTSVAFDPGQNAIEWDGATLGPGQSATLTFQVKVNPQAEAGVEIPNRAGYESTQTPYFLSNEVVSVVQGSMLDASKRIVGSPAVVHPNETVTFEVLIENDGTSPATNLVMIDPFPGNAAYVTSSMQWSLNSGPFISLTDANDGDEGGGADGRAFADRMEFRLASLGASQNARVRFRVVVDPGTAGQFLGNQATFGSDQTPSADTNFVQVPIVGNADVTGHVFEDTDGDGVQDPGEPDLANIDVVVIDATGVQQIVTTDANGDYTATVEVASSPIGCYLDNVNASAYNGSNGTLDWSSNPWVEYGDGADANPATDPMAVDTDPLAGGNTTVRIQGVNGNGNSRGFTRQVDLDPSTNATLSYRFLRQDFEADDVITLEVNYGSGYSTLATYGQPGTPGDVENDPDWVVVSYPLDGGQLPSDPVTLRWRSTGGFAFPNDEFFFDDVEVCAVTVTGTGVTLNVDEDDPDFPAGAVLTTANDPQVVNAVPGSTVASGDVGYQPPAITFTKTSDAVNNEVSPGQTITYTLTATNNTGVTQTGINISDPLPADTTWVPGSTQVVGSGANALRVTEYFLGIGTFAGTAYDLTLNQNLAPDYFVIVQGSGGDGTGTGNRGPARSYAALTRDPFATGQLTASGAANRIRIERAAATNSWVGVVTVVECLAECDTAGFQLLDVRRVAHTGTATSGAATAAGAWSDINQVMLMGGFNGAGCYSTSTSQGNFPICHARIWPSGSDQVNWSRDNTEAALGDATSTVMVLDWGSEWTVQRTQVQGNNGGDGANAAGEYNTAAISPVARDNTWVWGTGHTNDSAIGEASEGCLITLGDGAAQLGTEASVAVGSEYAGNNYNFEVYAMTHPDLATDYRFKIDGDTDVLTYDVPVDNASAQRMALAYNGLNGNGTAYPRPNFSARYLNDTTVRMQRRRSGQPFPAWVQGIDFTNILASTPPSGGAPPNLVVPSDGYTISPGGTLTVTFQVVLDPDTSETQVVNQASLATTQNPGPFTDSVTDSVVRAGVVVEYDNAGFDTAGKTVVYQHEVVNTGEGDDSFDITLQPNADWAVNPSWPVDLVDPSTGAVIASDANGDGIWDGGITVNTGTLGPGESTPYEIRVHIPGTAPVGDMETTALFATSNRNGGLWAVGTNETVVVDSLDPIILLPDNSGVGTKGGQTVYTHRIINNTGAPETFDLEANREDPLSPWGATFYWDSNADGVYTPGVDIAITNTAQLPQGGSQVLFMVVDVPLTAPDYSTDVVHLSAWSRTDPDLHDTATDTTTVQPPIAIDLSGGGTRNITGGDTAVFPGTLRNFADAADRMEFSITDSWFFGVDAYLHPSQLWIDTDDDGVADFMIAEDTEGNGTWDFIETGYDSDGDDLPDLLLGADSELAYELRRPVANNQNSMRDPVTLTVVSVGSGDQDSVTATTFLAAPTRAVLASFEAYAVAGRPVVEWRTAAEVGTIGYELLRLDAASGRYEKVHPGLVPGARGHLPGARYHLEDRGAKAGQTVRYVLRERDVWGTGKVFGPFDVKLDERPASIGANAALAGNFVRTANFSSVRTAGAAKVQPAGELSGLVKVHVRERGLVWVSAEALAEAFGVGESAVSSWIAAGFITIGEGGPWIDPLPPEIFSDGFETGLWKPTEGASAPTAPSTEPRQVAWIAAEGNSGLYFYGEDVDSIYTNDNVYWLQRGLGSTMPIRTGFVPAPAEIGSFVETLQVEQDNWPLTSVMTDSEADYWMWDYFFPYDGEPSVSKSFTIEAPGVASGGGQAQLTLHLQGSLVADVSPNHLVEVRLNGSAIGGASWGGHDALSLELVFDQNLLIDGANTVEITALLAEELTFDEFYLDSFELRYVRDYRAHGDRLHAVTSGAEVVAVDGFTSGDIVVFDISDPATPVMLHETRVTGEGGAFQVSFDTDGDVFPFFAATPAVAVAPAAVVADQASQLADAANQGRYVVIAGDGLESAAQAMADYRAQQGLSTVVARVVDIYDEFSGGLKTPWAIRDFLQHASATWADPPRYVFLAGDGSLDHKNVWGDGDDFIPAPMAVTADGLIPSDNLLADWVGGDGVPEVAIGRLPAQTAAELEDYREKVEVFESTAGPWKKATLWLADDGDVGGYFTDDIDEMIESLPADAEITRVSLEHHGVEDAWDAALGTMNEGVSLVNFLGHGGFDRLTEEGLLDTDKAVAMANGDRTPFLTALSCVVGRFDVPGYDTLSEALLLNDGGGAVAVWSPSGYSMNDNARLLGRLHTEALTSGETETIGDSVRAALEAYAATSDEGETPHLYVLIGDPATKAGW